jgi:Protein of unknown function (DUF3108)
MFFFLSCASEIAQKILRHAIWGCIAFTSLNCQVYAYDHIEARYVIRLLGIPMGTAALSGSVDEQNYSLEITGRLTGIATLISRARGAAKASGHIDKDRILPLSFATTASNTQMTRTVRMSLTNGTVKAVDIFPPFEELPGRVPVLEEHKKAVVDPLSALIMPMISHNLSAASCNRTIAIYDGWTRFNINLTYAGEKEVSSSGYNGPVIVCAARYVPIAGHRPEREATKFMVDNKDMEVWLAPLSGSNISVPFKISVATMIGTTVIEALEFQTDHQNRPLHHLRRLGQNEPHH